ncbi:MAG TPA: hypothetical protein ACFYEG_07650 [Candidatus Wujingus californicus]|uniref:hypothetical protein n=1 Tax=Candidatus Wujingus californicus TaxID=3367618 RepID=UPI004025094C
MKFKLAFCFLSLFFTCFSQVSNSYAGEILDDGFLWLTKAEINEKFGKPTYLYAEEDPCRRYVFVLPENENALRATFLYDVVVHDFYNIKRETHDLEYRFYYGEDLSESKKIYRVKEYSIIFNDNPVALGKVANLVPEFKPAYECKKVFQERLLNYNNIRLIFVTERVNDLSKHIGSLHTDRDKDIKDWSLSYKVILCDGEPENVTENSMVKEIIVLVDGEYRIGKTANIFGSKLIKNPLQ